MRHIAVLLADDTATIRASLRSTLKRETDIRLVGEAEDGLQAVFMAAKVQPDVVLMDLSMPNLNGLEAMRQILKSRPVTRVLMLSAYTDEAYVTRAKTLGAAGYLSKQGDLSELANAIRRAFIRGPFIGPPGIRPDSSPEKAKLRRPA